MGKTTYRHWSLGAIVILAALSSLVQAAPTQASLQTTQVRIEGHADTDAKLVGIFLDPSYGGNALPNFTLHADYLRIETDYADPVIDVEGNDYAHGANVTVNHHGMAEVRGTTWYGEHETSILPMDSNRAPTIKVESQCSSMTSSDAESIVRRPWVRHGARPDTVADASHAVRWYGCHNEVNQATVTGDFVLAMRGQFAQLSTPGESVRLESGRLPSQHSPHPVADENVYRYQQLYLYARGATITIPLKAGNFGLYVSGVDAQTTQGVVAFQEATGSLRVGDETLQLQSTQLALTGALRIQGTDAAYNDAMEFLVSGEAGNAVAGGQLLSFYTPTPIRTPWLEIVTALVAVAAIAAMLYAYPLVLHRHLRRAEDATIGKLPASTRRQRRAAVYGRSSDEAIKKARQRRGLAARLWAWQALVLAHRAHKLDPKCRTHLIWRSWAHAELGHDRRALRDGQSLDEVLTGKRAKCLNAWLAAQCADALGREDESAQWTLRAESYDRATLLNEADALHDRGAPMTRKPRMADLLRDIRDRSGFFH